MSTRIVQSTITLLLLVFAGTGAAAQSQTQRSRLSNGLTMILRPIKGAKSVCVAVVYQIGADHDPAGRSGLAHLMEHVYITAAAGGRKPQTVSEFMEKHPAGWEAQTGSDYTV